MSLLFDTNLWAVVSAAWMAETTVSKVLMMVVDLVVCWVSSSVDVMVVMKVAY